VVNEDIDVVILCGGMGTHLREETEYRPKPMVEIGGRFVGLLKCQCIELFDPKRVGARRGSSRIYIAGGVPPTFHRRNALNGRKIHFGSFLALERQ
jgi:hypothetical protein